MTYIKGAAPNLQFSHIGLSVKDIDAMEAFYTGVLGFTVTDRGDLPEIGLKLVFLSRDPNEHHQIVLATGRPDTMPANTVDPRFGPSINQLSFKLGDLSDLRDMRERLENAGVTEQLHGNHGIAWTIYAPDPEGNNLEFFVDTDWYFPQPFLIPLDLTRSDDEIYEDTRRIATEQEGYVPYGEWRTNVAEKMNRFRPVSAS